MPFPPSSLVAQQAYVERTMLFAAMGSVVLLALFGVLVAYVLFEGARLRRAVRTAQRAGVLLVAVVIDRKDTIVGIQGVGVEPSFRAPAPPGRLAEARLVLVGPPGVSPIKPDAVWLMSDAGRIRWFRDFPGSQNAIGFDRFVAYLDHGHGGFARHRDHLVFGDRRRVVRAVVALVLALAVYGALLLTGHAANPLQAAVAMSGGLAHYVLGVVLTTSVVVLIGAVAAVGAWVTARKGRR